MSRRRGRRRARRRSSRPRCTRCARACRARCRRSRSSTSPTASTARAAPGPRPPSTAPSSSARTARRPWRTRPPRARSIARLLRSHGRISKLREQPDRWLEAQGRLAEPLLAAARERPLRAHLVGRRVRARRRALRGLASPDEAVFYTSGRTSNEAAFLYQLFVREFGTNNLPDCSNMCHESSGVGLGEMIGVGKGTVCSRTSRRPI